MDISKVNSVLERAIVAFQEEEIEAMVEATAVGSSSYEVPAPTKKGMPRKRRKSTKPKKVKSPKNAQPPVTVEFLGVILSNRLTSWDRKYGNMYSLGHLFNAMHKADKATKAIRNNSDTASLEKYRAAVKREFTPGFAPIKSFEKALDNYLKTGKRPRLVK
jgi:hypothetical protein